MKAVEEKGKKGEVQLLGSPLRRAVSKSGGRNLTNPEVPRSIIRLLQLYQDARVGLATFGRILFGKSRGEPCSTIHYVLRGDLCPSAKKPFEGVSRVRPDGILEIYCNQCSRVYWWSAPTPEYRAYERRQLPVPRPSKIQRSGNRNGK